MKAQFKRNKLTSVLAVRTGTTGDTTAIQKTVDNCNAKEVYLNTLDLDGVETQVVSVETAKDSGTFAHMSLDTFILSSVSKMYPRDAVIGGRIPLDGTWLNGVVDSRAMAIRQILNGVEVSQQTRIVQASAQTSDSLLKQSVLAAIEERLSDIRAYMLRCYDSVLTNPAAYIANNADTLHELGFISLSSYDSPFELPIERILSLLQAEKYHAQLEQFKDALVCNKATNFRVHETYLVCDGQPTDEQRNLLESKGYELVAKDTTTLQAEITTAMTNQDFASVVKLSQDLLTLQNTVEIRKALAE